MKIEASDIAEFLHMRPWIERGIYTYGLKWLSLVLHIADSDTLITALVPGILAPELASVVHPVAGTVAR